MSGPDTLVERLMARAISRVPEDNPLGMTPDDFLEGQAAAQLSTLRSRCAELEAERDAEVEAKWYWKKLSIADSSRANAAEAARDEAVRALEPFAKIAAELDALGHSDDSTCVWRLKAGDIRRARDIVALATQSSGKEKGDG